MVSGKGKLEKLIKVQNRRLVEIQSICRRKKNVTEKLKFVLGRVENIVAKVENASYQHFLLYPQCSQVASFSRSLKV